MNSIPQRITYKNIFKFWYPLAATWLMMATEGFILAAIIARLPEPKINLAAYGVAYSLLMMFGAPVFMIMSASTAQVTGKNSYIKLRNFTGLLNCVIFALMLIFIIPQIFNFVTMDLIGLPDNISQMVFVSILIFLPWPPAVGYRRFYQGILIRNNYTKFVAVGSAIRISTMITTSLILARSSNLQGVYVGCIAFTCGILVEMLVSRLMANRIVKRLLSDTNGINDTDNSYRWIFFFYLPLALTSLLSIGSVPLLTFFMGQSKFAIESLAVYPVVFSLIFIFSSISFSFLEAIIALMSRDSSVFPLLKRFAIFVGLIVTGLLGLLTFTPLSRLWFQYVSGLSMELTEFAILPARIITIFPGLTMVMSFLRAILVLTGKTRPITGSTIFEIVTIILFMVLSVYYLDMVGAVAATTALLIGRLCSNLYLIKPYIAIVRELKQE